MTRRPQAYRIMNRECDGCLMTKDRIVSGERAAEIIQETRAENNHFICHKAQVAGQDVLITCRGHHDRYPSLAYRFARVCGIPVLEVDPETFEERPYEAD